MLEMQHTKHELERHLGSSCMVNQETWRNSWRLDAEHEFIQRDERKESFRIGLLRQFLCNLRLTQAHIHAIFRERIQSRCQIKQSLWAGHWCTHSRKQKILEKLQSDDSASILYRTLKDAKWTPHNPLNYKNYTRIHLDWASGEKKGLSFIQRREGTFCASEFAGIEPTPPDPEEQGMPALTS
jgi:hypothetical protein